MRFGVHFWGYGVAACTACLQCHRSRIRSLHTKRDSTLCKRHQQIGAVSDGDAVAVGKECFASRVAAAAAPASTGRVDSKTTWLPVPLRSNLRATANGHRPLPPAPSSRGPCPDPSRNYARSGAAPTKTQTVSVAIPSFSAWTFSERHPVLLIIYGVSLPGNCPASLRPTAARPVENIPLQAEHHSGRRAKLFAFPPESRSPSDRNRIHLRPDSPAFQSDPAVVDGKSQQCPILFPKESFRIFQRLTNDLCAFWPRKKCNELKKWLKSGQNVAN